MLFGKVEYFEDLFIAFKTYCPEKGGHRKLLLSVEVCIHNIVDVCCKFYPRTFEGYYSCRVQFSPVGMDALTEEYTWRPVQLGDNNTFSAVYDKCAPFSHIRHCSEIDILDNSIEILVFRIGAIEFKLCLKRDTECQTALYTLINGIPRRVNVIIEEFENEIISCIGNWEVFCKDLKESFFFPVFRSGSKLEKLSERFQLNFQKIGIIKLIFPGGKTNSFSIF